MFKKRRIRDLKQSFPFLSTKGGKGCLKFDSMSFELSGTELTVTFNQKMVPLFSYSFNLYRGETLTISPLSGDIPMEFE